MNIIRRFIAGCCAEAIKESLLGTEMARVNDALVRLREQRLGERVQRVEEKTDKTYAEVAAGFAATLTLAEAVKARYPELFK